MEPTKVGEKTPRKYRTPLVPYKHLAATSKSGAANFKNYLENFNIFNEITEIGIGTQGKLKEKN